MYRLTTCSSQRAFFGLRGFRLCDRLHQIYTWQKGTSFNTCAAHLLCITNTYRCLRSRCRDVCKCICTYTAIYIYTYTYTYIYIKRSPDYNPPPKQLSPRNNNGGGAASLIFSCLRGPGSKLFGGRGSQ